MGQRVKYYANEVEVFAELLRRYVCFHNQQEMESVKQWGLANYGEITKLRRKGYVRSTVTKVEKTGWFVPTKKIIDEVLRPAYQYFLYDAGNLSSADLYMLDYTPYIHKALAGNKVGK